jgi:hypothetical protein
MKLSQVKVKEFSEASMAALETAINAWLVAREEQTFIALHHYITGADYTALIVYTE